MGRKIFETIRLIGFLKGPTAWAHLNTGVCRFSAGRIEATLYSRNFSRPSVKVMPPWSSSTSLSVRARIAGWRRSRGRSGGSSRCASARELMVTPRVFGSAATTSRFGYGFWARSSAGYMLSRVKSTSPRRSPRVCTALSSIAAAPLLPDSAEPMTVMRGVLMGGSPGGWCGG